MAGKLASRQGGLYARCPQSIGDEASSQRRAAHKTRPAALMVREETRMAAVEVAKPKISSNARLNQPSKQASQRRGNLRSRAGYRMTPSKAVRNHISICSSLSVPLRTDFPGEPHKARPPTNGDQ